MASVAKYMPEYVDGFIAYLAPDIMTEARVTKEQTADAGKNKERFKKEKKLFHSSIS